jgi:hypothetical protein
MTGVITQRSCAQCGAPMPAGKRASARTCSDQCRKDAYRARHGTAPSRPGIPQFRSGQLGGGTERNGNGTGTERQAPAAGWDAPGEPRGVSQTSEPCPECGTPLHASPRQTMRACLTCTQRVIPAGVAAPYQRGPQPGGRQVRSQRERDLDAIALAQRKGVMLDQLARLASDPGLHEQSRPVVDWFAEQVRAATSPARLDELADLLPDAGIRRRHWWQGEPAAITAAPGDDEPGDLDDYDPDDDGDYDDRDDAPGPAAGIPASAGVPARPALTWAGAMDALGLRLAGTVGGCQIISGGELCGAQDAVHHVTGRHVRDAWICGRHHGDLAAVIAAAARR